jgi:hypothetical protein
MDRNEIKLAKRFASHSEERLHKGYKSNWEFAENTCKKSIDARIVRGSRGMEFDRISPAILYFRFTVN